MIDEREFAKAINHHFEGKLMSKYEWDVLNDVLDILSDVPRIKSFEEVKRSVLLPVQERFEEMEHETFNKPHGLKEHAVWNKAIQILEKEMEG